MNRTPRDNSKDGEPISDHWTPEREARMRQAEQVVAEYTKGRRMGRSYQKAMLAAQRELIETRLHKMDPETHLRALKTILYLDQELART